MTRTCHKGQVAGRFAPAVVLLVLMAASAQGQSLPVQLLPPAGTEIRAVRGTALERETVRGFLVSGTAAQLVIGTDSGARYEIPASELLSLEADGGRSAGRGALKGLGFGAIGGAVIVGVVATAGGQNPGCEIACSGGAAFTLGAVVGALLGAPLGAIVGAIVGSQKWETVW